MCMFGRAKLDEGRGRSRRCLLVVLSLQHIAWARLPRQPARLALQQSAMRLWPYMLVHSQGAP